MMKFSRIIWISLFFYATQLFALPEGFVYLSDIDSSIIQNIRYHSHDNFLGRQVKGYDTPRCILTRDTALALAAVQKKLKSQSLSLKIYDCYRPQMAVDDFIAWSKDSRDQKMKSLYYPYVNKADFFKLGYAALKSGHTRGSTVDLTVVSVSKKMQKIIPLRMGTHFDFMDPASNTNSNNVSYIAKYNRLMLQDLMIKAGFVPTAHEWWHFTLKKEAFPKTYFNFPIR